MVEITGDFAKRRLLIVYKVTMTFQLVTLCYVWVQKDYGLFSLRGPPDLSIREWQIVKHNKSSYWRQSKLPRKKTPENIIGYSFVDSMKKIPFRTVGFSTSCVIQFVCKQFQELASGKRTKQNYAAKSESRNLFFQVASFKSWLAYVLDHGVQIDAIFKHEWKHFIKGRNFLCQ